MTSNEISGRQVGRKDCGFCGSHGRRLVAQGLALNDQAAWWVLADHFEPDVKVLVGTTPAHEREDVYSAVNAKLPELLAGIPGSGVRDMHGWTATGMRHAKIEVLRSNGRRRRHEAPLVDDYATYLADADTVESSFLAELDGTHDERVERCLTALRDAYDDAFAARKQLLVECIQVVEVTFLADVDGEVINRAEACRRLGLTHDYAGIGQKLSRVSKNADTLPLHKLMLKLGPSFARLFADETVKENG